jgi:hypothetical protein
MPVCSINIGWKTLGYDDTFIFIFLFNNNCMIYLCAYLEAPQNSTATLIPFIVQLSDPRRIFFCGIFVKQPTDPSPRPRRREAMNLCGHGQAVPEPCYSLVVTPATDTSSTISSFRFKVWRVFTRLDRHKDPM